MKFKEKLLCFNAIGFGSGSSKLLNLSKIILNNISVVSIKALLILRRIFEFCLKRAVHINNEIILLIIVYPREILPNSSFWLLSWHMYHSLVTACIFLARFFSCRSMNIWEGFFSSYKLVICITSILDVFSLKHGRNYYMYIVCMYAR